MILATCTALFASCQNNQPSAEIIVSDEVFEGDDHNALTSLDFMGIYEGLLPCADCEGVQIEIELGVGNSYVKKLTFLGSENNEVIENHGAFSWNDEGNTITLEGEDAPNRYFVGENTLIQLDLDGNRISGELANRYILNKH